MYQNAHHIHSSFYNSSSIFEIVGNNNDGLFINCAKIFVLGFIYFSDERKEELVYMGDFFNL